MKNDWSLNKELCKITNTDSINHALYKIGLIDTIDSTFEIIISDNWTRSGAETYIYKFWIKTSQNPKIGIVLKACVAFSPGTTLDKILDQWIYRRNILRDCGISTPYLYAYSYGVIVEELIDFKLIEVLSNDPGPYRNILIQLTQYAATLEKLKFAAINPFNDLMSRGNDVVIVDFGQDLGPSQCKNFKSNTMFNLMIKSLKDKFQISLTDELYEELFKIYDSEKNSKYHNRII